MSWVGEASPFFFFLSRQSLLFFWVGKLTPPPPPTPDTHIPPAPGTGVRSCQRSHIRYQHWSLPHDGSWGLKMRTKCQMPGPDQAWLASTIHSFSLDISYDLCCGRPGPTLAHLTPPWEWMTSVVVDQEWTTADPPWLTLHSRSLRMNDIGRGRPGMDCRPTLAHLTLSIRVVNPRLELRSARASVMSFRTPLPWAGWADKILESFYTSYYVANVSLITHIIEYLLSFIFVCSNILVVLYSKLIVRDKSTLLWWLSALIDQDNLC